MHDQESVPAPQDNRRKHDMTYEHIETGTFKSRPNRFIAHVDINGKTVICHVKNTGRCRELLIPGVTVILEYHPDAALTGRKTEYDLIGVYKGNLLINMDSQAPNRAVWEWLTSLSDNPQAPPPGSQPGPFSPFFPQVPLNIRREVTHGDSRFDLAFSLKDRENGSVCPAFMEVKGVTLEDQGLALFPDAPTERGIKHLRGLIRAQEEGYNAFVFFLIQMKGIHGFSPNDATHPAFGEALREAEAAGVTVLAYDCLVTRDSMCADSPVPVLL